MKYTRDIGRMGENFFAQLCASAGLAANKSDVDVTGWDYFVEFPFNDNPSIPMDMQKPAIECKVQVKSTDTIRYSYQIKLSNLRRLATTHQPTFIIIFGFNHQDNPQSVYLIHIDENLIGKILEKIRVTEQVKKKKSLHTATMRIAFDESMRLPQLSGSDLKSKITEYVGDSIEKYVKQKHKILATTGFDQGRCMIKFSLFGEDNFKKMIDAYLGKPVEIENVSLKMFHSRFGIRDNTPSLDISSGRMAIGNILPHAEGEIHFSHPRLCRSAIFPCKIYTHSFPSNLPKLEHNIRIVSDFCEILGNIELNSAHVTFNFSNDSKYTINELQNISTLFRIISTNAEEVACHIKINETIAIDFSFTLTLDEGNFSDFFEATENASFLACKFAVLDTIKTSVDSLRKNNFIIRQFKKFIEGDVTGLNAEFNILDGKKLEHSKPTKCLFFNHCTIGDIVLGAIYSAEGLLSLTESGSYHFKITVLKTEKMIAGPIHRYPSYEKMTKEFERIEMYYDKDYQTIRLFSQKTTHTDVIKTSLPADH